MYNEHYYSQQNSTKTVQIKLGYINTKLSPQSSVHNQIYVAALYKTWNNVLTTENNRREMADGLLLDLEVIWDRQVAKIGDYLSLKYVQSVF